MFAGPNGSGKSTLKAELRPEWLGTYVNPDEIELALRMHRCVDFAAFDIEPAANDLLEFVRDNSSFVKRFISGGTLGHLSWTGTHLFFDTAEINSYLASFVAEFVRQKLVADGKSFTFETVMSHPDKVEFLKQAREKGYRIYLYFIATSDPRINLSRIESRVNFGGHGVPEEKVLSRYVRSLELLWQAILHSDRAYIFDNSTADKAHTWIAEITDGMNLELRDLSS